MKTDWQDLSIAYEKLQSVDLKQNCTSIFWDI